MQNFDNSIGRSSFIFGATVLIGVVAGTYFLSKTRYFSQLSDRRNKKKKQEFCNICFAELNLDDIKNCIPCCNCQKSVCRGKKCSYWLPKLAKWECHLCNLSQDSQSRTSEWLNKEVRNENEFYHPIRARSELNIRVNDEQLSHTGSINHQTYSPAPSSYGVNLDRENIRNHVEEILADILGGPLDNVSVGPMSKSKQYYKLFKKYHSNLSEKLYSLENSMRQFNNQYHNENYHLHCHHETMDLPLWENGVTNNLDINNPSNISHIKLKRFIEKIIDESLKIPQLTDFSGVPSTNANHLQPYYDNKLRQHKQHNQSRRNSRTSYTDDYGYDNDNNDEKNNLQYFDPKRYQELLATAILNKIVDSCGTEQNKRNTKHATTAEKSGCVASSSSSSHDPRSDSSLTDPIHDMSIGEISNRQYVEPSNDNYEHEPFMSDSRTSNRNFQDIISSDNDSVEDCVSVASAADSTWEENWLFKKRKLVTHPTASISMLVPAPREDIKAMIGDKSADELSDFSENDEDDELNTIESSQRSHNDRIQNKSVIGGQNAVGLFDELMEQTSLMSNSISNSSAENPSSLIETKNDYVDFNYGLNVKESPSLDLTCGGVPLKNEAVNPLISSEMLKNNERESEINNNICKNGNQNFYQTKNPNPIKTCELDPDGNNNQNPDTSSVDNVNRRPRRHSAIEFLAAIALGPVLTVCSPDMNDDVLKNITNKTDVVSLLSKSKANSFDIVEDKYLDVENNYIDIRCSPSIEATESGFSTPTQKYSNSGYVTPESGITTPILKQSRSRSGSLTPGQDEPGRISPTSKQVRFNEKPVVIKPGSTINISMDSDDLNATMLNESLIANVFVHHILKTIEEKKLCNPDIAESDGNTYQENTSSADVNENLVTNVNISGEDNSKSVLFPSDVLSHISSLLSDIELGSLRDEMLKSVSPIPFDDDLDLLICPPPPPLEIQNDILSIINKTSQNCNELIKQENFINKLESTSKTDDSTDKAPTVQNIVANETVPANKDLTEAELKDYIETVKVVTENVSAPTDTIEIMIQVESEDSKEAFKQNDEAEFVKPKTPHICECEANASLLHIHIPSMETKINTETVKVISVDISAPTDAIKNTARVESGDLKEAPKQNEDSNPKTPHICECEDIPSLSVPSVELKIPTEPVIVISKDVSAPTDAIENMARVESEDLKKASKQNKDSNPKTPHICECEDDASLSVPSVELKIHTETVKVISEDVPTPTDAIENTARVESEDLRVNAIQNEDRTSNTLDIFECETSVPLSVSSVESKNKIETQKVISENVSAPTDAIENTVSIESIDLKEIAKQNEDCTPEKSEICECEIRISLGVPRVKSKIQTETVKTISEDVSGPADAIENTARVEPEDLKETPKQNQDSTPKTPHIFECKDNTSLSIPSAELKIHTETVTVISEDISAPTDAIDNTTRVESEDLKETPKQNEDSTSKTPHISECEDNTSLSIPSVELEIHTETVKVISEDVSAPTDAIDNIARVKLEDLKETPIKNEDSNPKTPHICECEDIPSLSVPSVELKIPTEPVIVISKDVSAPTDAIENMARVESEDLKEAPKPNEDSNPKTPHICECEDNLSLSLPSVEFKIPTETIKVISEDVSAPTDAIENTARVEPEDLKETPKQNQDSTPKTPHIFECKDNTSLSIPSAELKIHTETVTVISENISAPTDAIDNTTRVESEDLKETPKQNEDSTSKTPHISECEDNTSLSIPSVELEIHTETVKVISEDVSAPTDAIDNTARVKLEDLKETPIKNEDSTPKTPYISECEDNTSLSIPSVELKIHTETVKVISEDVSAPTDAIDNTARVELEDLKETPKQNEGSTPKTPHICECEDNASLSIPSVELKIHTETVKVISEDVFAPTDEIDNAARVETEDLKETPKQNEESTPKTPDICECEDNASLSIPSVELKIHTETVKVISEDVSAPKDAIDNTARVESEDLKGIAIQNEDRTLKKSEICECQTNIALSVQSVESKIYTETVKIISEYVSAPKGSIENTARVESEDLKVNCIQNEDSTPETPDICECETSVPLSVSSVKSKNQIKTEKFVSEHVSASADAIEITAPVETGDLKETPKQNEESTPKTPDICECEDNASLSIPSVELKIHTETVKVISEDVSAPTDAIDNTARVESESLKEAPTQNEDSTSKTPHICECEDNNSLSIPSVELKIHTETVKHISENVSATTDAIENTARIESEDFKVNSIQNKDSTPKNSEIYECETSVPLSVSSVKSKNQIKTEKFVSEHVSASADAIEITAPVETGDLKETPKQNEESTPKTPDICECEDNVSLSIPSVELKLHTETVKVISEDVSAPTDAIDNTARVESESLKEAPTQNEDSTSKTPHICECEDNNSLSIPSVELKIHTETVKHISENVSASANAIEITAPVESKDFKEASQQNEDSNPKTPHICECEDNASLGIPSVEFKIHTETVKVISEDVPAPIDAIDNAARVETGDLKETPKQNEESNPKTPHICEWEDNASLSIPSVELKIHTETVKVISEDVSAPTDVIENTVSVESIDLKERTLQNEDISPKTSDIYECKTSIPLGVPSVESKVHTETVKVISENASVPTDAIEITIQVEPEDLKEAPKQNEDSTPKTPHICECEYNASLSIRSEELQVHTETVKVISEDVSAPTDSIENTARVESEDLKENAIQNEDRIRKKSEICECETSIALSVPSVESKIHTETVKVISEDVSAPKDSIANTARVESEDLKEAPQQNEDSNPKTPHICECEDNASLSMPSVELKIHTETVKVISEDVSLPKDSIENTARVESEDLKENEVQNKDRTPKNSEICECETSIGLSIPSVESKNQVETEKVVSGNVPAWTDAIEITGRVGSEDLKETPKQNEDKMSMPSVESKYNTATIKIISDNVPTPTDMIKNMVHAELGGLKDAGVEMKESILKASEMCENESVSTLTNPIDKTTLTETNSIGRATGKIYNVAENNVCIDGDNELFDILLPPPLEFQNNTVDESPTEMENPVESKDFPIETDKILDICVKTELTKEESNSGKKCFENLSESNFQITPNKFSEANKISDKICKQAQLSDTLEVNSSLQNLPDNVDEKVEVLEGLVLNVKTNFNDNKQSLNLINAHCETADIENKAEKSKNISKTQETSCNFEKSPDAPETIAENAEQTIKEDFKSEHISTNVQNDVENVADSTAVFIDIVEVTQKSTEMLENVALNSLNIKSRLRSRSLPLEILLDIVPLEPLTEVNEIEQETLSLLSCKENLEHSINELKSESGIEIVQEVKESILNQDGVNEVKTSSIDSEIAQNITDTYKTILSTEPFGPDIEPLIKSVLKEKLLVESIETKQTISKVAFSKKEFLKSESFGEEIESLIKSVMKEIILGESNQSTVKSMPTVLSRKNSPENNLKQIESVEIAETLNNISIEPVNYNTGKDLETQASVDEIEMVLLENPITPQQTKSENSPIQSSLLGLPNSNIILPQAISKVLSSKKGFLKSESFGEEIESLIKSVMKEILLGESNQSTAKPMTTVLSRKDSPENNLKQIESVAIAETLNNVRIEPVNYNSGKDLKTQASVDKIEMVLLENPITLQPAKSDNFPIQSGLQDLPKSNIILPSPVDIVSCENVNEETKASHETSKSDIIENNCQILESIIATSFDINNSSNNSTIPTSNNSPIDIAVEKSLETILETIDAETDPNITFVEKHNESYTEPDTTKINLDAKEDIKIQNKEGVILTTEKLTKNEDASENEINLNISERKETNVDEVVENVHLISLEIAKNTETIETLKDKQQMEVIGIEKSENINQNEDSEPVILNSETDKSENTINIALNNDIFKDTSNIIDLNEAFSNTEQVIIKNAPEQIEITSDIIINTESIKSPTDKIPKEVIEAANSPLETDKLEDPIPITTNNEAFKETVNIVELNQIDLKNQNADPAVAEKEIIEHVQEQSETTSIVTTNSETLESSTNKELIQVIDIVKCEIEIKNEVQEAANTPLETNKLEDPNPITKNNETTSAVELNQIELQIQIEDFINKRDLVESVQEQLEIIHEEINIKSTETVNTAEIIQDLKTDKSSINIGDSQKNQEMLKEETTTIPNSSTNETQNSDIEIDFLELTEPASFEHTSSDSTMTDESTHTILDATEDTNDEISTERIYINGNIDNSKSNLISTLEISIHNNDNKMGHEAIETNVETNDSNINNNQEIILKTKNNNKDDIISTNIINNKTTNKLLDIIINENQNQINNNANGDGTNIIKNENSKLNQSISNGIESNHIKNINTNTPKLIKTKNSDAFCKTLDYSDEDDQNNNLIPGSIAEREHKKWYNAVEMPNNPYAPEALLRRLDSGLEQTLNIPNRCASATTPEEDENEDGIPEETLNTKKVDLSKYSRDYYVPSEVKSNNRISNKISSFENNMIKQKQSNNNENNESTKITKQQKDELIKNVPTKEENQKEQIIQNCDIKIPLNTIDTKKTDIFRAKLIEINDLTDEEQYESIIDSKLKTDSSPSDISLANSLTLSEDSDTLRIYNLNKQETTKIILKNEQKELNDSKLNKITATLLNKSSIPITTTKLQPRAPRIRPNELNLTTTLSTTTKTTTTVTSPQTKKVGKTAMVLTPQSFKFLHPKRKLIEPSQIITQEQYNLETPETPDKPVIEEDVVHTLPSVKALAKAFLLTSGRCSEVHERIRPKSLIVESTNTNTQVKEQQIQQSSSLEHLHLNSIETIKTNIDNRQQFDEKPLSPSLVMPGKLRDNIAFFENLKKT